MDATMRAASLSALVALVGASTLTFIFHHGAGSAFVAAALFGAFAAGTAFVVVGVIARRRVNVVSPVLGGKLGALAALGTFLVTVTAHTAFYPGNGGFLVSLPVILGIGVVMFGWGVALVGVGVGLLCERLYFSGPKR